MFDIFPLFERNTEMVFVVLAATIFGGLFVFELLKRGRK